MWVVVMVGRGGVTITIILLSYGQLCESFQHFINLVMEIWSVSV